MYFFNKYLSHACYLQSVEWNTKELHQGLLEGFYVFICEIKGENVDVGGDEMRADRIEN